MLDESEAYGSTMMGNGHCIGHGLPWGGSFVVQLVLVFYYGSLEHVTFGLRNPGASGEAARGSTGGQAAGVVFFIGPLLRGMKLAG